MDSILQRTAKQVIGEQALLFKLQPLWTDLIGIRRVDGEFEFALSSTKGPLWYSRHSAPQEIQRHLR